MNRTAKILFLLAAFCALPLKAQITFDSLTYQISNYGDVILRWTPPQGTIVSQYNIYRGTKANNFVLIAEIHSSAAQQYIDHHSNVIPGTSYYYWVEALDAQGHDGSIWTRVTVTPPTGGLTFTSDPPSTAFVGKDYTYAPISVDASQPEDIEYTFGGPRPDGMQLNSIAGGIYTFIYWQPPAPGQYRITLIATHKKTRAVAVQEFSISVASQAGTVRGSVRSVTDAPIAGATVRVFQTQNGMSFETTTDPFGDFILPNVQIGDIYAYVKPPSSNYVAQWYPLGRSLKDVPARPLKSGDTLVYPFRLLTSPDNPTPVSGFVIDASNGRPVEGAALDFVRKNSFLHIGDTTIISNPSFLEDYKIDTTVATDASGAYAVNLNVGQDFYVVVRKPGYLMSFAPERSLDYGTNALKAWPFRVEDGIRNLSFRTWRTDVQTSNRIVGIVQNFDNGINKEAIVILINSDVKRGAGGGHTYLRSTFTDKNGYYAFDNLAPLTATYSVLAIPLNRDLLPQYFTSQGGTEIFTKSEDVSAIGTVQDIDFRLRAADGTGVGTVYGRVQAMGKDGKVFPLPGTLLFAENTVTKTIAGYAITDSTGWYSIVGLPKGNYMMRSDNFELGSLSGQIASLQYTTYNLLDAARVVHFMYDLRTAVDETVIPNGIELHQNFPNPFNPSTTISYAVPTAMPVTLRIFSAIGQELMTLVDTRVEAGTHKIEFDASSLPSGMYFYRLQTGSTTLTRSMVLMK